MPSLSFYAFLATAWLATATPQGAAECLAGSSNACDDVGSFLQSSVRHDGAQNTGLKVSSDLEKQEILGPVVLRILQNSSEYGESLVQSISNEEAESSSDSGCSCTWNPSYPCELSGSCYSYSTKAACEGAGGAFCGSSTAAPTCPCTWNAAYPCSLWGSCYGVTDEATCKGYGGELCGDKPPTPAPTPPPPVPPPSPTGAGGSAGTLQPALDKHNEYRQLHGAPALTWDSGLASQAQSWADRCVFEHSKMGNGENLYAGTGNFDAAAGVTSWYNELTNPGYDFNNPGFTSGTGHFTQVVWKSTTKLGCAVKVCNSLPLSSGSSWENAHLFVCEYSPPGNYRNQFADNVKPSE